MKINGNNGIKYKNASLGGLFLSCKTIKQELSLLTHTHRISTIVFFGLFFFFEFLFKFFSQLTAQWRVCVWRSCHRRLAATWRRSSTRHHWQTELPNRPLDRIGRAAECSTASTGSNGYCPDPVLKWTVGVCTETDNKSGLRTAAAFEGCSTLWRLILLTRHPVTLRQSDAKGGNVSPNRDTLRDIWRKWKASMRALVRRRRRWLRWWRLWRCCRGERQRRCCCCSRSEWRHTRRDCLTRWLLFRSCFRSDIWPGSRATRRNVDFPASHNFRQRPFQRGCWGRPSLATPHLSQWNCWDLVRPFLWDVWALEERIEDHNRTAKGCPIDQGFASDAKAPGSQEDDAIYCRPNWGDAKRELRQMRQAQCVSILCWERLWRTRGQRIRRMH